MNILDIQDKLKGLSEGQLAQEMQMPSGSVPQFLVLGEMNRRQSMRQSMQQQGAGSQTVAQELLNGAGIPYCTKHWYRRIASGSTSVSASWD